MTATESSIALATTAAKAADEKIGEDIAVIDVSSRLVITDCFVVVTGDNERHVAAITDEIEDKLREEGARPIRREGVRDGRWCLLDYGQVVIHVFRRNEREFYGLDRLWQDCPLITVDGITPFARQSEWADDVDVRAVSSIDEIPLAAAEPDTNEM